MTEDHRPIEDRLRDALAERATTIEPSPDGLDHIEEELMTQPTPGTGPNRWLVGVLSAAAAAVLVLVAVAVFDDGGDDDSDVAAETTTTEQATTTSSTTTTTEATSSTTAFAPLVDPYDVAYPDPETAQRFESPAAVASAYATDVLGFTDLAVGQFRAGDTRSGEVPVTDGRGGPETIVLVRQMDDEAWFALGSVTENIAVDEPQARDGVSTPLETSGTALAFEGTVVVQVLSQADRVLLGEGVVTGSGVPPAGPFEGTIDFEPPEDEQPGIVVYLVRSPGDGHVTEATSFPVRLTP